MKTQKDSSNAEEIHGRSQHPHPTATHKKDSLGDDHKQLSTTDQKEAASLLRQAPALLKQVEQSYLLQRNRRQYPTFRSSEVTVGPLLGVGGFGVVFEVENLTLQPDFQDVKEEVKEQPKAPDGSSSEIPSHRRKTSEVSFSIPSQIKNQPVTADPQKQATTESDDSHYDVRNARRHMVHFVRRDGDARYAIKRLQKDLPELARARGQIDLALEATFLSGLWHPNISECCPCSIDCAVSGVVVVD